MKWDNNKKEFVEESIFVSKASSLAGRFDNEEDIINEAKEKQNEYTSSKLQTESDLS